VQACETEGCERGAQPGELGGFHPKCCITCGNTSFPDVHLAWCEVRNGTHHSQTTPASTSGGGAS
jgi:hypothetical protein